MQNLAVRLLAAAALVATLPSPVAAQIACPGQGTELIGGTIEFGPDMNCPRAPGWPWWHLYTPPHRAVVRKPGWQQGPAHAFGRVLLQWRCTGFLLVPVVPDRLRLLGYVMDVAQDACSAAGR